MLYLKSFQYKNSVQYSIADRPGSEDSELSE